MQFSISIEWKQRKIASSKIESGKCCAALCLPPLGCAIESIGWRRAAWLREIRKQCKTYWKLHRSVELMVELGAEERWKLLFFLRDGGSPLFFCVLCETDSLAYVRICVTHFWSPANIFPHFFFAAASLWSVNGRSTVSLLLVEAISILFYARLLLSHFIVFEEFCVVFTSSLSLLKPVQTHCFKSMELCNEHSQYIIVSRTVFEWFYVMKARKAIISC